MSIQLREHVASTRIPFFGADNCGHGSTLPIQDNTVSTTTADDPVNYTEYLVMFKSNKAQEKPLSSEAAPAVAPIPDENTVVVKEDFKDNSNQEKPPMLQLININSPKKVFAIKNIMFLLTRPKTPEKISKEKELRIAKLLSEFRMYNTKTKQQKASEFFRNVKIIKAKIREILDSGI